MPEVGIRELCSVIRSKQAGPYRLTLDLVFKDRALYELVKESGALNAARVAALYRVGVDRITHFVFYDPGWAIKISLIRPIVAGAPGEGDAYGCQQHAPLLGLRLALPAGWDKAAARG